MYVKEAVLFREATFCVIMYETREVNMFNKMTKSTVSQIAAAFALALAPVPASTLGVNEAYSTAGINTTLSANPGEFVFLPIDEATAFMSQQTERLNAHLRAIKIEWEVKRIPIEMDKQSAVAQKYLLSELKKRADLARGFLAAARLAISDDAIRSNEKRLSQVKTFARSASSMLYAVEDFLSFMDQTYPPIATTNALSHLDANEVKAMIRAEHKALGLDAPSFDS